MAEEGGEEKGGVKKTLKENPYTPEGCVVNVLTFFKTKLFSRKLINGFFEMLFESAPDLSWVIFSSS